MPVLRCPAAPPSGDIQQREAATWQKTMNPGVILGCPLAEAIHKQVTIFFLQQAPFHSSSGGNAAGRASISDETTKVSGHFSSLPRHRTWCPACYKLSADTCTGIAA